MRRRGLGQFNLTVTAPADIDDLSLEALKALVVQLLSKVAEQERLIAELREENARLKGLNGRPRIKPSGMEDASLPKRPGQRGKRRRRGKIVPRVAIEDRVIKAQVPPGSRFKGYETFVVQDIVLRAEAIRYRRERWITPHGMMVLAPLPAGVSRAFRARVASFRAGATPSGPGHGAAAGGTTAGDRRRHLQATGDAPADRWTGRVPRREP